MPFYAVIDTNVLVSALITKHLDAAPLQIVNAVFKGKIIPLYHQNIIQEYREVLSRPKFHLQPEMIQPNIESPASLSGGHYETAVGAERIGISH